MTYTSICYTYEHSWSYLNLVQSATLVSFDQQMQLIAKQQEQIDALREEGSALRQCLAAHGVLSQDAFLAELHRAQFDKIFNKHPLG